jgi:hypothetical protein
MQKIVRSYIESLPPAVLYEEDINHIYGVLRDGCGADKVKLETDEYVLDELDQLKQLQRDSLSKLRFIGSLPNGRVVIEIAPERVFLFTAADEPQSRGLLVTIRDYIAARPNPYHRRWVQNTWFLMTVMAGAALAVLVENFLKLGWWAWILLGVGASYASRALLSYLSTRLPTVVLKPRREASSFWARKSDDVFSISMGTAIGTIFGMVLGSVLTWYVMRSIK